MQGLRVYGLRKGSGFKDLGLGFMVDGCLRYRTLND